MSELCVLLVGEIKRQPGFHVRGWRKINGRWSLLGGVPAEGEDPAGMVPALGVEQVAGKLNELERELMEARAAVERWKRGAIR